MSKYIVFLFCVVFVVAQKKENKPGPKADKGVAGFIYTLDQANSEFGLATDTLHLDYSEIEGYVNDTTNAYIMFDYEKQGKNGVTPGVEITNGKKKKLKAFNFKDKGSGKKSYKYYSAKLIRNLHSLGKMKKLILEIRRKNNNEVFSISNGAFVLESAYVCPPFCE